MYLPLPGPPDLESDFAFWSPSLKAWIAGSGEKAEWIREAVGPEVRVMLARELEEKAR